MRTTLSIALAVSFLVGAAAPSLGAVHYVTPVSPYTWAESTNPATPATLSVANANVAAGDVVYMYAGEYPTTIAPTRSGSASTGWIRYVGSLSNPALVSLTSGLVINSKNRISVAGVRFRDDTVFERANTCSLSYCLVDSGGWVSHGLNSDRTSIGVSESLHVYNVVYRQDQSGSSKFGQKLLRTRYSTFNRCVWYKSMDSLDIEHRGRFLYQSRYNTWTDCKMIVEPWGKPIDEQFALGIRDSSQYNTFTRDTLWIGFTSRHARDALMSHSGSWPGWTGYNVWDSCDYRSFGGRVNGYGAFSFQDAVLGATIRNSVFASSDTVTMFLGGSVPYSNLDFTHNTFFSRGRSVFASDASSVTGSRFRGNAFITTGATGCGSRWLPFALKFIDSIADNDSNAVVSPDTSQVYRAGSCYTPRGYVVATGRDAHSSFTLNASLAVEDTVWATLDLRPKAGSPLVSASFPDGYAGAFDADTCGDADRPGTVTDFMALQADPGQFYVQLWLTKAGPNQFAGDVGDMVSEVRESSSPILTESDWNAARVIFSGVTLADLAAGDYGVFADLIESPTVGNGVHWFAWRDSNVVSGERGCLSNTDSAYVTAPDMTPPAAVANLLCVATHKGIARLTWSAPADAEEYDIRLRMGALDASTWDDTTRGGSGAQGRTYFARYPVAEPPTALPVGQSQSMSVALRPGATFYFAVKSRDATGNWSAISNVDSVTVPNGTDAAGFPRFYQYGAAEPAGGLPPWYPYLEFDGRTLKTLELDKLARYQVITINPEAPAADSFDAVVRYLRWRNPAIKILYGAAPDVAYYKTTTAANSYRDQLWAAITSITPWPSSFALPYSSTYGVPQGYGATPDTTTASAILWSRNLGRKNAMWGTLRLPCPCATGSGVHANAGVTLRNLNLGYRDPAGRYVVAESLAYIEKRMFYDRTYKERDGSTRRVWDGPGRDLHSYFADLNNTFNTTNTDSLDWLRMGYANRPLANDGFTAGAIHFDRLCALLMPEFDYYGSNGYAYAGHDFSSGGLLEGYPAQQGGTPESNLERRPGGHAWNAARTARKPSFMTLAASPGFETVSDSSMFSTFNPDTNWSRKEFRFGLASALLSGSYFVYGPGRFSPGNGVTHPRGAYYAWPYDERLATLGQSYLTTDDGSPFSQYLGAATGDYYGHYPSSNGAIFRSSFPDSSIWQSLQKNADGRVTVRPGGPSGFSHHLEIRPAALFGADWRVGALSKTFAVTAQDYTISFWLRADTTRAFQIGFRDSATGNPWSGSGGTGRSAIATPTWRPMCFRVFNGGSSANVQLAIYAGDTLGTIQTTGWQVHAGDSTMFIREFEHGAAIVNFNNSATREHVFGRLTKRLEARAGVYRDANTGAVSRTVSIPARDGLIVGFPSDSTRPAAPNDVSAAAACGSALVEWTATGDDSLSGTAGLCEVRHSSSAINAGNYDAATYGGSVTALSSGAKQSLLVQGLPAGTRYFAVKVVDEIGFTSAISNVVSVTIPACSASPAKLRPAGTGGRTRTRSR